jgi:hypothetical protein
MSDVSASQEHRTMLPRIMGAHSNTVSTVSKITNLRTKGCLLVKVASDKVTVFLGCYTTHAMDTNTARVTNHFTHHVLCHLIFIAGALLGDVVGLTAYWPLGDVIRPFVWCDRCRRLTEP